MKRCNWSGAEPLMIAVGLSDGSLVVIRRD